MTEIQGTTFKVDGRWYLRYLHGSGVMIPINANAAILAKLVEGKSVAIIGSMSTDHRGFPQSVSATEVTIYGA